MADPVFNDPIVADIVDFRKAKAGDKVMISWGGPDLDALTVSRVYGDRVEIDFHDDDGHRYVFDRKTGRSIGTIRRGRPNLLVPFTAKNLRNVRRTRVMEELFYHKIQDVIERDIVGRHFLKMDLDQAQREKIHTAFENFIEVVEGVLS